jgi:DNA-binding PadR family transcriptional regulator
MLTRLIILWLLSERPLHGYRIKTILGDRGLRFWFPIEDASIYSMLNSLVKEGLAKKVTTEREGKRPKRTLYAITPEGRRHYEDLLREAWRNPISYTDPIQVALAASGDLPDKEVARLSEERLGALEERLKEVQSLRDAAPDIEMVNRESSRLESEINWLRQINLRNKKNRTQWRILYDYKRS